MVYGDDLMLYKLMGAIRWGARGTRPPTF